MNKNKKNRRKESLGDKVFHVINISVFLLFTLICAYPFYYIFINTISDNRLVSIGAITIIPKGIHFENYKNVLTTPGLANSIYMSLARTIVGTLLTVFVSSIPGYIFSRPEVWHRKLFFRLIFVPGYVSAGMVAVFLNIKNLGLMNNFLIYVLPGAFSSYYMILIKTYIESGIPASMEEAAYIDGAGYFQRYTRVVMPLCKPVLATCAVFAAVGQWNSFMDTILYAPTASLQTLQTMLYKILNQATAVANLVKNENAINAEMMATMMTATPLRHTVTMFTVLPILLVYPFFQKYFASGIMMGAVKG